MRENSASVLEFEFYWVLSYQVEGDCYQFAHWNNTPFISTVVTEDKEIYKNSALTEEDEEEMDWGQEVEQQDESEGTGCAALTPYR